MKRLDSITIIVRKSKIGELSSNSNIVCYVHFVHSVDQYLNPGLQMLIFEALLHHQLFG